MRGKAEITEVVIEPKYSGKYAQFEYYSYPKLDDTWIQIVSV